MFVGSLSYGSLSLLCSIAGMDAPGSGVHKELCCALRVQWTSSTHEILGSILSTDTKASLLPLVLTLQ